MTIDKLFAKLAAPAKRALQALGLAEIEDLARYPRSVIAELHGIGPNALETIEQELASLGVEFLGRTQELNESRQKNSALIDEYIQQFAEPIRTRLTQMRRIIASEVPQATEMISYAIPAFYLHGNLIHYAGYEHHVGLYPGSRAIAHFWERIKGFKTAKGTVQFSPERPLPEDLIREIIRFRTLENLQRAQNKKDRKKS